MSGAKRRLNVLVTRPRGEADMFAVALAMHGHDALVAPLLDIVVEPAGPLDLDGVQGVLFTSANGVRAFAHSQTRRDLPAFCVGNATANAARNAGFANVESAAGDVDALADLVRAKLDPGAGALVHAAGTAVAGDLAGALGAVGFEVRREKLYRADMATSLPPEIVAALRNGQIDAVTFFSPRTAEVFARLVQAVDLGPALAKVTAVALAQSALDIAAEQGCRFKAAIAADQPSEAALLDVLDRIASEPLSEAAKMAAPQLPPPVAPAQPASLQPAPAKPSGGALAIVVALIAGITGSAGWTYLQSHISTPVPLTASAPSADPRVAALERRLAQIEARPTAANPVSAAPAFDAAPLDARLAALESRPALDQNTQATLAALMAENRRLAGELARVQGEIDRLQGGIVEQTADRASVRRAELQLAVGQLRDAAFAGRPFAAELALVRELGSAAANDAALARAAPIGIETRASLQRRFPALANTMVAASRTGELQGRWAELVGRLQGMLSVRRVGEIAGDDAGARVARAEARLALDDLAGALGAFDGAQGAAWTAPARDWIDAARLRLDVERALATLAAQAAASGS
jgi:uroporphyrinogen-III synthase